MCGFFLTSLILLMFQYSLYALHSYDFQDLGLYYKLHVTHIFLNMFLFAFPNNVTGTSSVSFLLFLLFFLFLFK